MTCNCKRSMISFFFVRICIPAVWICVTLYSSQNYRVQPLPTWPERCDLISHTEVFLLHVWVLYVFVMFTLFLTHSSPMLPHGWTHLLIIWTGKPESQTLPDNAAFQRFLLTGRRISPWSAWKQFTVKEGGIKKVRYSKITTGAAWKLS